MMQARLDGSEADCSELRDQLVTAEAGRRQLAQQLEAACRERDQLLQNAELKLKGMKLGAERREAASDTLSADAEVGGLCRLVCLLLCCTGFGAQSACSKCRP